MTETDAADAWGAWLRNELDLRNWRQADLVRESQGHIKRDRVSKWTNGNERPTYRLAVVVANSLGVPVEDALNAAGYSVTHEIPDSLRAEHDAINSFIHTDEGRLTEDSWGAANELRSALRNFGDPGTAEVILQNIPSAALIAELSRRLDSASNVSRRRDDYGLVANDTIDEAHDVPDSDFDNA